VSDIAALQEAVATHVAAGQTEEAKKRLRQIERDGTAFEAAQATYLIGVLEARVPETTRQAEATLQHAVDALRSAGAPRLGGRALAKLAMLAAAREDYDVALAHLADAAEAFTVAGEPLRLAAALRLRALVLALAGDRDASYAAFADALQAAVEAGADDLVRALRLDRAALFAEDPTGPGEEPPEPTLLDTAASRLRAGDVAGARTAAATARDGAIGDVDPIGFLLASIVLGETHEAERDFAGAMVVLLECKTMLGDLLGEGAAVPVAQYIVSLANRWGEQEFEAALREAELRYPG
jgi:hypothetical protein